MLEDLRAAHLCYNHLAEQFGTEVPEKLLSRGWLMQLSKAHGTYNITPEGEQTLAVIGIDMSALRNGRRRSAYGCTDWGEHCPHLAGALRAAMAERCITLSWLARQKHLCTLNVAETGQRELHA